jgi:hypothetical protein
MPVVILTSPFRTPVCAPMRSLLSRNIALIEYFFQQQQQQPVADSERLQVFSLTLIEILSPSSPRRQFIHN